MVARSPITFWRMVVLSKSSGNTDESRRRQDGSCLGNRIPSRLRRGKRTAVQTQGDNWRSGVAAQMPKFIRESLSQK